VALFTLAMWQWSHFTTQSGMSDFFWPLILRGIGLGLVFVPLNNLTISSLPMERVAEGTGLFGLARQLGGSLGIAFAATLVPRFASQARAGLSEHVTLYNPAAVQRLAALKGAMLSQGTAPGLAEAKAIGIMTAQVTRQATMLSFERIFLLFGWAFVLALPLLLVMRWRRIPAAPATH